MFTTYIQGTDLKYKLELKPTGNNGVFLTSFDTLPEVADYCKRWGKAGDFVKITNKFNNQVKELTI